MPPCLRAAWKDYTSFPYAFHNTLYWAALIGFFFALLLAEPGWLLLLFAGYGLTQMMAISEIKYRQMKGK